MRQEYLRAAAEAYANLNELQSDCYHYLNDGFDTSIQSRLASSYTALLSKEVPRKYIDKIVCTALVECQYPINESTGYAWSGNERAAFANIPKATWSRNQMSDHIDFILNNMSQNAASARAKIQLQLVGYSEAT
ncbi:hypothetical protein [Psychrobacter sp. 72-O-c]|uniref:hypothetical protein n=1 Tax=Psychrobacter sp. 72-O-c TaxID=2774125 RepID=UPI00191ABB64|nr:hypothetical protein [Psychrobacter sp. 72-O-c]